MEEPLGEDQPANAQNSHQAPGQAGAPYLAPGPFSTRRAWSSV
ncbi:MULTISPECIES: hypothetical protein [Kineosporia]|nr:MULTISPECIES: hypothetical protein [Kineosporia]